jgi:hypothetical protein
MATDEATGQITDDDEEDNVRPLRHQRPAPLRPGARRTSLSGSTTTSNDDAKAMIAHARILEVEGASDRLGLVALRESLESSEEARRGLTEDLVSLRGSFESEINRVQKENDRLFDAAERRRAQEADRWADDRDRLQREIDRLEREIKDQKKAKKKHKKSVANLEIALETLKEEGATKRSMFALLAPGVPPLANEVAKVAPAFFTFIRNAFAASGVVINESGDDSVEDRAAAMRFAGRLFDPQNEDLLDDLKSKAYNVVVEESGESVVVSEWDRVQRYIWSALRHESDAADQAGQKREVIDPGGGNAS